MPRTPGDVSASSTFVLGRLVLPKRLASSTPVASSAFSETTTAHALAFLSSRVEKTVKNQMTSMSSFFCRAPTSGLMGSMRLRPRRCYFKRSKGPSAGIATDVFFHHVQDRKRETVRQLVLDEELASVARRAQLVLLSNEVKLPIGGREHHAALVEDTLRSALSNPFLNVAIPNSASGRLRSRAASLAGRVVFPERGLRAF